MSKISSYGPSIVVIFTVIAVLLAGPRAIEALTYHQTRTQVILASDRLAENTVLEQINQAHRDIATVVEPSVVYISARRPASGRIGAAARSSGSGWIYNEQGHIITNAHVIEGADAIEVQLHNGQLRRAEIVGTDMRTDIAVIRIPSGGLHPAKRGNRMDVHQGDRVFAFGSPFDFRFSMSAGIVSGLGRTADLASVSYQNFIQVDAAINPGNSGGPLTNIHGEVIGMNTAIATGRRAGSEGVFSGIGLAIPIDMIENVVMQLIERGEVSRGYIGVSLSPLTRDRTPIGFTGDGVLVMTVEPDSPAARAGLRPSDVITHVQGIPVNSVNQLSLVVSSHLPGEQITVTFWRQQGDLSGDSLQIEVELAELPALANMQIRDETLRFVLRAGFLSINTATEERAARFRASLRRGVIVEQIVPNSPIDGVLVPGSIITEVQGTSIDNIEDFYLRLDRALATTGPSVRLRVVSPDGREAIVPLQLQ